MSVHLAKTSTSAAHNPYLARTSTHGAYNLMTI